MDDEDLPELREVPGDNMPEWAFDKLRAISDPCITDGAIRELNRFNDYNFPLTVEVCALWPAEQLSQHPTHFF